MDASHQEALRALTVAYCEALHHADTARLAAMCHERFTMHAVGGPVPITWDRDAFLERVRSRDRFPGDPCYEILSVDAAGGEMGRAHLWVDVPPRRFEDHLGFARIDGEWKLLTKLFRTQDGPALEG